MGKSKSLEKEMSKLSFTNDEGKLTHPIIETHCHLDYLKNLPLEEILEKSKSTGIEKIITISVTPSNLNSVLKLSLDLENVYTTQGIHPHEANLWNDEVRENIERNLNTEMGKQKIVAIGEIGLDYYYHHSSREEQIKAFKDQLDLAIKYNLPVVIHTRDAEEDTKEILQEYSPKLNKKGVLHSFTSKVELAKFAIQEGFYLGFNGIITFKNAANVREVVEITPLDKILLETDAPYLTPDPFRGRENAPYYLPFTAKKIMEIKEVDSGTLLKTVYQNSLDLFTF